MTRINKASFLLIIFLCSCFYDKPKNEIPHENEYYRVNISNQDIVEVIKKFIKKNKLNPKASLVFLNFKADSEGNTLYLSYTSNSINRGYKKHMAYSLIDSSVIILNTSNYYFPFPKMLDDEISTFIKKKGVILNENQPFEHNDTWTVRMCGEKTTINTSPILTDGIPCGYSLKFEGNKPYLYKEKE